jgi:hypothetical protein
VDAERVCNYVVKITEDIRRETNEVVSSQDHIEIIKHYAKLRDITSRIKEAREALDGIEKNLSYEKIPEALRGRGIKTLTIEGVGRVSLSNRWSCSMLDKELGLDWLRNSGNEALIIETVNSSTLAAFAKNMTTEEGKELPDNIFKTSILTVTSITKA